MLGRWDGSGAFGAQPVRDDVAVPCTVIGRKMAAVDGLHRQVQQALHAGDILLHLGGIVAFDQRAVIDDIARDQQPVAVSNKAIPPGLWPGVWITSKWRSPRSMMSRSCKIRVAGADLTV